MKIKFNWGTGIVIAMLLFMIFILSFVYKTIAIDKYEHHLVSEDYYKDELYYQEEIDKLNNASKLSENITLSNSSQGVTIQFPNNMDFNKIKGTIHFQRRSNYKLDFDKEIKLNDHFVIIPDSSLVSGKWIVKIDWQYNDEKYLLKESWFY